MGKVSFRSFIYVTVIVLLLVAVAGVYFLEHGKLSKLSKQDNIKIANLQNINEKLKNQSNVSKPKVVATSSNTYVSGATCKPAQLSLAEYGNVQVALSNREAFFSVTNISNTPCALEGYPTFTLMDGPGQPTIGYGSNEPAKDAGNYFTQDPGVQKETLAMGSSVYFSVGWVSETAVSPEYVQSIMPGTTTPIIASVHGFGDWSSPETITALAPLGSYNTSLLGLN